MTLKVVEAPEMFMTTAFSVKPQPLAVTPMLSEDVPVWLVLRKRSRLFPWSAAAIETVGPVTSRIVKVALAEALFPAASRVVRPMVYVPGVANV